MKNGCKIRPEWIPEAYKSNDSSEGNISAQPVAGLQQTLPGNALYGYHKKRHAWQRYSKR